MHFDKEQQRKEFEEKFANPRKLSISRYDNIYADEFTQLPWEAWQAAIEQASQRIAQLETYISDNLHKKAVCGCGDSIEPDTGAVCGNCASETQGNLERLIEAKQTSQPQSLPELEAGISAVVEPMLREELQDLQATFDLRWKADMRAIEMWRAKIGKELMMPDHADLCVWLLEQLEQASHPQEAQRQALKELAARLRQITAVNMPLTIEQRELINAIDERLNAI